MTPSGRSLSDFEIHRQPDDSTCGPTCLHAVYRHFGDDVPLEEIIAGVRTVDGGGTLGVLLATHALSRGYKATIITWNLQVFDPTWFPHQRDELRERLQAREEAVNDSKLRVALRAYDEFLAAGGKLSLRDLEEAFLRRCLQRGLPILTGLSASFLYREMRERASDCQPDDVAGDPVGHFVVLTGYSEENGEITVSDPMHPNPLATSHTYPVPVARLIGAVYLGVLTYDGNLIVLEPPSGQDS